MPSGRVQGFLCGCLEESDKLLSEFDEGLWLATVDATTVHSEHKVTFKFKDGLELGWKI